MKTTNKPTDYAPLFHAIKARNEAVYALAKTMAAIKKAHGRKTLEDITLFDTSGINMLCRLGNLSIPADTNIYPEHYDELCREGATNKRNILQEITTANLKPSQLRKKLRVINTSIVTKEKKITVNNLAKYTLLLQNELKAMKPDQQLRAAEYIKQHLL